MNRVWCRGYLVPALNLRRLHEDKKIYSDWRYFNNRIANYIFGYYIYRQPYREAEKQHDYEENLIDQYLEEDTNEIPPGYSK